MMNKNIKAVIFDMDGTMLNNLPWHIDAWQQTVRKYFPEFKGNVIDYFGMKNAEIFRAISGNPNLSNERVQFLEQKKEGLYQQLYRPHMKAGKGFMELLDYCRKNKIPAAIATSAPKTNLDFMLDELDLYQAFDAKVHSEMVGPGKPNPEIFYKAAELMRAKAEACLVFEDSIAGLQAAKNAGMRSIRLNWQNENTKPWINELFVAQDFLDARIFELIDS